MRALLIAGPTASGKSELGLTLARRHNGVVVNADALQVYDHLEILTARPGPRALADAPHRLYGIMRPRETCSAARYAAMARAEIDAALGTGRLPIVVGGTGLYFRALTEGLADIPPVPEMIRAEARQLMDLIGPEAFHGRLDPEAARRIRPTDRQRMTRAYEVRQATGSSLFDFHGQAPRDDAIEWHKIALAPERAELHARIDGRFIAMMDRGALQEAEKVAAMDLDPSLPSAKALGLRPLMAHLDGGLSLDDAVARGQAETRQYAKRQQTWIRTQMTSWHKIAETDPEKAAATVESLFGGAVFQG